MVYWSITFATVAITLLRSRWWQSLPSPWSSSSWDFSSQTLRLIKPRMVKEKQKKMFSQVEGFWSLAVVAYIAFVCVVSAVRTQVILRHWAWMSSRSLKYSTDADALWQHSLVTKPITVSTRKSFPFHSHCNLTRPAPISNWEVHPWLTLSSPSLFGQGWMFHIGLKVKWQQMILSVPNAQVLSGNWNQSDPKCFLQRSSPNGQCYSWDGEMIDLIFQHKSGLFMRING